MRTNSSAKTNVAVLFLRLFSAVACASALLVAASLTPAVTLTWDANTGTPGADDGAGTWNTTNTNWWNGSGNVSWSSGTPDAAVFGAGGVGNFTVTLGEPITAAGVTFNAGPTYTVSGNTLTLTSSITVNSAEARIDSAIAGGTVHKFGNGRLILAGNSTFGAGGAMDVRGGVLNLRHDNALGNSSYCHVYVSDAALEVQDGIIVSNDLYIKGQGAAGAGSLRSLSGDNTWAGWVRLHWDNPNAAIGVDAGTLTITGQIQNAGGSGGGLTKVGDGTLILASSNSYTWPTYVNAGVLNIRHGDALGTTAGGTTVASGAALEVQNDITVAAEALTLNGAGISSTGALRSVSGNNVWNGPIVENSAGIGVDTGSTLTINGVMSGSGTFRKYGGGKLILTGNNTYAATTDVGGGVLNIRHDNALGTASYCHVYSGAALELENDITVARDLYIGNGSSSSTTVNLHNVSGDNAWNGTVHIHAGHPWAIIGVEPGTSLTINGPIDAYNGTAGSLTKVGAGTLALNGSNSFRTATFVNEGVLNVGHANALGTAEAGTTVASGAALQVQNDITVAAEALTLNGAGISSTGALRSVSGNNVWNGPVVQNSAGIGVDTGSTLTINGVMSGSGTFRKYGGGKLILTAANTYAATTDVAQGILNLRHGNALGTASYCHVYSGAALELENDITVARDLYIGNGSSGSTTVNLHNVSGDNAWTGTVHIHASHPYAIIGVEPGSSLTINGPIDAYNGTAGSLTKVGAGTLTLNGSNSFRTATFVNEGVLSIGHANALGTAEAGTTVASGAALQVQNDITVGAEALTLNGAGISSTGALRSVSGNNVWNGPVVENSAGIGVDTGSTLTINGVISGSGTFRKYGGGKLILTGNNTYAATTDVIGGVLNIRHDNALGTASYCHVYVSDAALEVQDGITVSNGLYIKGGGAGGAGSLRSVSGDNTWAGYVRLHWDNPAAAIGVDADSTLTVTGVVEPAGGTGGALHKVGDGTLILANSNTYHWPTYVDAGTLLVDGSIAASSGATVAAGATLGGHGTVPGIDGAGLVSPGSSPGIFTAASVDGSGGLDFAFEFTAPGDPDYGNALASINDVLRLTDADPFSATPLEFDGSDPDNTVDIYFDMDIVGVGDTFRGGFFTDRNADFLSDIAGAEYNYYVRGDGHGHVEFLGTNYYSLEDYLGVAGFSVSTVPELAHFVGGDAQGYVMQLTAVPEPGALVLMAVGALGLIACWWRRRHRTTR